MQLFFDRFGALITIVLAVLLAISTTMWIVTDQKLDKRISTLEGCCDEVQQYMEAGNKVDEAKLQAIVDSRIQEAEARQSELVSQTVEAKTESLKEEITTQIGEKISEEVKAEMEKTQQSSGKASSKKKRSQSSVSSATVSQSVTTQTSIETTHSADATKGSEPSDPDDRHFKVGSGEEEED
ncbi:MAG: hypothetical protein K6E75_10445 [Lachnospiraceae bacterium]|nr:hypothetical protein [Lachnospiraceae bacterium]